MSKKVTWKSSDGETFEIDEAVALESETIKHVIEEDFTDNDGIKLPNVKGKILAKVIQFCKKHIENPRIDEELRIWDQGFVKVDHSTLFDLILAAYFLNIKNLLDVTCQTVADLIRGKTPEEVRRTFNLDNESTSEEDDDEDFWWQNQWAFE